jgi:hypothetical protein
MGVSAPLLALIVYPEMGLGLGAVVLELEFTT